jgi:hypothetical protein
MPSISSNLKSCSDETQAEQRERLDSNDTKAASKMIKAQCQSRAGT